MSKKNPYFESKRTVADIVADLLWSVDHREWPNVQSLFGTTVEVDYTSLIGGSPTIQHPEELVNGWREFLPGFDKTQHMAGPILATVEGDKADARCAITATHTLGKERWIVGGHYNLGLENNGQAWKIVRMKLEMAYVDGNTDLPRMASERLKK